MATKGDRNMSEVYNDYKLMNSYIFIGTVWFYSHRYIQLTLTQTVLQVDWKKT
jgi:hypothetical protein